MRRRILLTVTVVAMLASSGCSDQDSSEPPADEATQERLREAYATLEAAAEDVPGARLPRLDKGEVEVVEKGETFESSAAKDLGLIRYFSQKGITFGLALIEDESERGIALGEIEFTDAPDAITLIIPKDLRHGSAPQLLAGGATFAAISRDGEIYCIDGAAVGVEPCRAVGTR
jgi:hypothetical protein